eukprot:763409-Hanusia_phi.AAC.11
MPSFPKVLPAPPRLCADVGGWVRSDALLLKEGNKASSASELISPVLLFGVFIPICEKHGRRCHGERGKSWVLVKLGLGIWRGEGDRSGKGKWSMSLTLMCKDMVVRVNCTSYRHLIYDTVVEFGHGSGGGIAFRTRDNDQPRFVCEADRPGLIWRRWVWEDGSIEFQDKLACDDLANALKKSTKKGIPKYRYNKVFWIASRTDGVITFRNALNPVSIQLHVSVVCADHMHSLSPRTTVSPSMGQRE